jgi:hypothetical protein
MSQDILQPREFDTNQQALLIFNLVGQHICWYMHPSHILKF